MDSICEIEYYCKIDCPVGALLLTGEWGCGKTYLIENELPKRVEKECVIIRISLFGIQTIEELHKAVKQAWIHEKSTCVSIRRSSEDISEIIDCSLEANRVAPVSTRILRSSNCIRIQSPFPALYV